jgi:acyl carrier protein
MNRDQVLMVVTRHISEAVEGLNVSEIDPSRSMHDHDLGSLDIVEVVSRSMRELRVKVPPSELRSLRTINELVDALHREVAT